MKTPDKYCQMPGCTYEAKMLGLCYNHGSHLALSPGNYKAIENRRFAKEVMKRSA